MRSRILTFSALVLLSLALASSALLLGEGISGMALAPLKTLNPFQSINLWAMAQLFMAFLLIAALCLKLGIGLYPTLVAMILFWVLVAGLFAFASVTGFTLFL